MFAPLLLLLAVPAVEVEDPPQRVGQIFVVGNYRTPQALLLDRMPLFPGQLLECSSLKEAERALRVLALVNVSGRVVLAEPESETPFKDVLVLVEEGFFTPLILSALDGVRVITGGRRP